MKITPWLVAPILALAHINQPLPAIAENTEHLNRALSTDQCLRCDLRGAGLVSAKLRRVNLTGSDLRESNLSRANLTGANLTNVDFRGASLSGADLSGSNLTGANLSTADLSGVNFSNANLKGAILTSSDLRKAYFVGANLDGANLENSLLRDSVGIPVKSISAEDYYLWATEEARRGNNKTAIDYFNKAVIVNPKFTVAYMGRAIALQQLGDKESAIQDSERASELYKTQNDPKGLKISQDLTEAIKNPPSKGGDGGGDFGNIIMGFGSLLMRFLAF